MLGIKELCNAVWPCQLHYLEEDLAFIGVKVVALIPI